MSLSRREFLEVLAVAAASGLAFPGFTAATPLSFTKAPRDFYEVPSYGNVSLLHFTDCHAQLLPVWFREPHLNIGIANMFNKVPHLVGEHVIKQFNLPTNSRLSYAHTYLNFIEAAQQYGKVGGFAHLATLINKIRAQRPGALLLDGGDTWQGSATSLWTNAQDMIDACLLLGVDIMTAHWEFTYGADRVRELIEKCNFPFLAGNVRDNDFEEPVFESTSNFERGGVNIAVIGQAFPYTPIANPRYKIPDWSFGIQEDILRDHVEKARDEGADLVVMASHNGFDVDRKLASRIDGIDVILTGHTHDAIPGVVQVNNTLLLATGSHSKFLGRLDLDVQNKKIRNFSFKLMPVFSDAIAPDAELAKVIADIRAPHDKELATVLAKTEATLYRRGNFNGTFDDLICQAMIEERDAEIALSPGFRWGRTVPSGTDITVDDLYTQTAITYPACYRNQMTGEFLKTILEDVADNLFNTDPYYQQGGDMVRVGGMGYAIDVSQQIGSRISDMTLLRTGEAIDPARNYVVSGWASVNEATKGPPIYDVVSDYLKKKKVVNIPENTSVKVSGL